MVSAGRGLAQALICMEYEQPSSCVLILQQALALFAFSHSVLITAHGPHFAGKKTGV